MKQSMCAHCYSKQSVSAHADCKPYVGGKQVERVARLGKKTLTETSWLQHHMREVTRSVEKIQESVNNLQQHYIYRLTDTVQKEEQDESVSRI
ncbi:hypothetical protein E2C01_002770 [Portunus trituberculatus]|uniref:Uncharacterized protein n=1 Tax=Portunus trituberculatus TaxID=210409 RepID=A0A5B7CMT4_PORTR|nr:hypothetical protein [Portunus trituberculatus]